MYRLLRGTGSGVFVASLAAVVVGFLIGNLLWRFLLALEPSFDGLDANDDARRFWRRPALNWVGRTYLARRPELGERGRRRGMRQGQWGWCTGV